jgi:NAD(P)-dependent dehydrogenase (short-subunit alcohol dehydrogenase family)
MAGGLRGKTIVITGASSGIGAAAARALARDGATVVPIGRSPEKTAAVAAELGVPPLVVDFGDFASVRQLAAQVQARCDRIDVLVHNAGGMVKNREQTRDGHERTLQGKYLGPFLLQMLLGGQLADAHARILVTSSIAHHLGRIRLADLDGRNRDYSMIGAYSASKLADLLFARQLARQGMIAAGFDPGFVSTDFLLPATGLAASDPRNAHGMHLVRRKLLRVVQPEVAATGIVRFATIERPERLSGRLISRSRVIPSSIPASSRTLAEGLWRTTEELLSAEAVG